MLVVFSRYIKPNLEKLLIFDMNLYFDWTITNLLWRNYLWICNQILVYFLLFSFNVGGFTFFRHIAGLCFCIFRPRFAINFDPLFELLDFCFLPSICWVEMNFFDLDFWNLGFLLTPHQILYWVQLIFSGSCFKCQAAELSLKVALFQVLTPLKLMTLFPCLNVFWVHLSNSLKHWFLHPGLLHFASINL